MTKNLDQTYVRRMKVYEEQLEDVLSDVLASLPRDSFQLKPEQKQAIRTYITGRLSSKTDLLSLEIQGFYF